MAPLGTNAVIYIIADGRRSWGARVIDAWYCGPSTDHYQNFIFFIPETESYRISGSFDLFPQHCLLPEFTPIQHTREVLLELTESVQQLNQQSHKNIIKIIEADSEGSILQRKLIIIRRQRCKYCVVETTHKYNNKSNAQPASSPA